MPSRSARAEAGRGHAARRRDRYFAAAGNAKGADARHNKPAFAGSDMRRSRAAGIVVKPWSSEITNVRMSGWARPARMAPIPVAAYPMRCEGRHRNNIGVASAILRPQARQENALSRCHNRVCFDSPKSTRIIAPRILGPFHKLAQSLRSPFHSPMRCCSNPGQILRYTKPSALIVRTSRRTGDRASCSQQPPVGRR